MRLLPLLVLLPACASALEDTTPYVTDARVLAVRAEPAEAEPGDPIRLVALYADTTGALADAPVDWSFCTALKPLAELGPVADACLDAASDALAPIGTGVDVTGALPEDACSLFGPNPPPPVDGAAAGRPTDPDVTGGYYQPALGFHDDGGVTLVQPRVRCGLSGVSQETYIAWNQGYQSNENPTVSGLTADIGGDTVAVPADGTGTPPTVAAGESVPLTVAWPDDCTAPEVCGGAETYVVYDADTQALTTRREAISATWFTTGGTLGEARNGRAGDAFETTVTNTWTAPDEPGDAWLGVVLRDERGGVDFAGYRLTVAP